MTRKPTRRETLGALVFGTLGVAALEHPHWWVDPAREVRDHYRRQRAKGRYKTIAHEFLQMEEGILPILNPYEKLSLEPQVAILDEVIDNLVRAVKKQYKRGSDSMIATLTAMNDVIDERFDLERTGLLAYGLTAKKIDCDHRTIICLAVAEVLGLSLQAARMPYHVFLQYPTPNGSQNWDMNLAMSVSNSGYISDFGLGEYQDGVFLSPLTRDGILSLEYFTMGSILGLKGHYELAEQYLTEAIRLNPKFPEAYCERGTARAILASANHDPTKRRRAIQDYDAAITLFPGFGKAHQFRKETLRKAA